MTTLYARTAPKTLDSPLAWLDRGLCRFRPDAFTSLATAPEAKRICVRCPVLGECRAWIRRVESGNSASQRENVVAGLTPDERTALDPLIIQRAKDRAARAATSPEPAPRVKDPVKRPQCGSYKGYRLHERNGEICDEACLAANAARAAQKRAEKLLPDVRRHWAQGLTDAQIGAALRCRVGTVRKVREVGGLQENLPTPDAA
ncbi:WhiB family transcriptional regulator [Streptomyces hydrogenans]|uniref:WhiB family transcriptional regulator n=1 Tax=Streptomyces hydrogenans TaxID=1873719 RepID=UPI00369D5FAC